MSGTDELKGFQEYDRAVIIDNLILSNLDEFF
jgi:hypothetical protein